MNWLVFSYSLPSKSSSPRVSVWRQLKRAGAISPVSGAYILPANDLCAETFSWLAQQVRQAGGDALVMQVERFHDLTDQALITRFHQARQENYTAIKEKLTLLDAAIHRDISAQERLAIKDELDGLQQHYTDIARIDYFDSPDKLRLAARLERLRQRLLNQTRPPLEIVHVGIEPYRDKRWVTRPRPFVDRLACAWLIRRYINPQANIRYSATPTPEEIAFDVPNAEFSHRGELCTFEVMLQILDLDDPALQAIAEIVHNIDLQDKLYLRPETSGIDAVLQGWQRTELPDGEMETRGINLFEGLYVALAGLVTDG